MYVIGFVGASGTGKSHNATWLANEKNISLIIDDGLLINKNKVIAGKSAKREDTKLGAVRCALFMDEDHADSVSRAILNSQEDKILILGTSDKMITRISDNLKLGYPDEFIYIDQIATTEEINKALNIRENQGKHVIPVPTMEIKKDFSGYFIDPLNFFRRSKGRREPEKTVVRPTFSYLGKFSISDFAIYQIIEHSIKKIEGVGKINKYRFINQSEGLYIDVEITIIYGYNIREILRQIKKKVVENIENNTGLNVYSLKANVKTLIVLKNQSGVN